MTVNNLDEYCPACERISGDHTLREWSACLDAGGYELGYEEAPADVGPLLRYRVAGLEEHVLADNVIARAVVIDGDSGSVHVTTAGLLTDWSIGTPDGPITTARVAYLGNPEGLRALGRLLRDTANAAANRAERAS